MVPKQFDKIGLVFVSDRLKYASFFSLTTTTSFGAYITRSIPGYMPSNCLAECFFTPLNDCHFAVTVSKVCYIGTFKKWPNESPPTFLSAKVYIYDGKFLNDLHLFCITACMKDFLWRLYNSIKISAYNFQCPFFQPCSFIPRLFLIPAIGPEP